MRQPLPNALYKDNSPVSLPESKPSLEGDLRYSHDQEYGTDDRIEAEKGRVDPFKAAPTGDPML
jgi:hypothetical protein